MVWWAWREAAGTRHRGPAAAGSGVGEALNITALVFENGEHLRMTSRFRALVLQKHERSGSIPCGCVVCVRPVSDGLRSGTEAKRSGSPAGESYSGVSFRGRWRLRSVVECSGLKRTESGFGLAAAVCEISKAFRSEIAQSAGASC